MARHYTIKEFFRQMPNALLARLFHAWDLFKNLNFSKMKEEPDKLSGFIETLSALPNHYQRAMITYLDYSECWRGATRFYHADTLTYWRKRKQMGHVSAAVDESSINLLADLIRGYFHSTEGRGNNCIVEPFRRGDLDYFFAYPEDYSQQSIEWMDGELNPRTHNPAFEIVYIYSQKDGTLDLSFHGSYKAIEPLQAMFTTAILKLDDLPPNPKDHRIYDLNPLRYKHFSFAYTLSSGIQNVAVKKLRFSSRVNQGERITLENDTTQDPMAIYNQFERMEKSVPLHLYNVTQVELVASVVVGANKPSKMINIRLTYPNSCSLKYDEIGLKLRKMLASSGIEPKEPVAEIEIKELIEA